MVYSLENQLYNNIIINKSRLTLEHISNTPLFVCVTSIENKVSVGIQRGIFRLRKMPRT